MNSGPLEKKLQSTSSAIWAISLVIIISKGYYKYSLLSRTDLVLDLRNDWAMSFPAEIFKLKNKIYVYCIQPWWLGGRMVASHSVESWPYPYLGGSNPTCKKIVTLDCDMMLGFTQVVRDIEERLFIQHDCEHTIN